MKKNLLLLMLFTAVKFCCAQSNWQHGPLRVSADGHDLQFTDGTPFFWLGDTGWELFHRLNKEEVAKYLDNRRRKGFTVIQAVALAEFEGLGTPNQYGNLPMHNGDPNHPNEKYFLWIDTVITMAKQRNLFIGLLPTWGDGVTGNPPGIGKPVFNKENAYTYGKWIAQRYADYPNIIWILGGDRPAVKDSNDWRPVWRAMAKGILESTGGKALISYHPQGSAASSKFLHQEDWLNMNMMQSGHGDGHDTPVWEKIAKDRSLLPVKPTLDAEPNYEDHPVNPWPTWNPANGYFRAYDVRKQIYRSVFAGACGVTYGHHSVWQFWSPREEKINYADRYWTEALDRPGAFQAGYLRRLIESRGILNRIPDQKMIVNGQGEKGSYITAFRSADSSYGMVYLPVGTTITIDAMGIADDVAVSKRKIMAWWFNPVTGKATKIGLPGKSAVMRFTPPVRGQEHDWVLVLDNPAKHFPPPGKTSDINKF